MAMLRRVDHVTYAVAPGTIERWAHLHARLGGGEIVSRIDDVRPNDRQSSMKLWCVRFADFGVALVEGIDRDGESQVSAFVRAHGDHCIQHVAYAVDDLDTYLVELDAMGIKMRGSPVTRNDGFGPVKQVFTKGLSPGDPAEASFLEFVERPRGADGEVAQLTFSADVGRAFYDQIEHARATNDEEPFAPFACIGGRRR
jgi:4-hydroxyphenylpyruvate dioxygenase-like putative hemolysin